MAQDCVDTRPYVDIPFVDGGRSRAGADCWGLVYLVSADLGRPVPAYPGEGVRADGTICPRAQARAVARHADQFDAVDAPRPGDVVLLRPRGRPMHVGVCVDRRGRYVMHTERRTGVCVERVHGRMWTHRLDGFYRYRGDKQVRTP